MKIFDRDNDGDFDIKDLMLMTTVFISFMNIVLNMFSVLDLGITFTNQEKPVLDCRVIKNNDANQLKCYKARDSVIPLPPTEVKP